MLIDTYSSFLVLDDGTFYKGRSFFENINSSGEVVFNTGMTGYQEIITDPSYFAQMVVFTYPELGNTGLNIQDSESNLIHIKGIIAKNICLNPSNWRSSISLKDYILKKRVPHIFGLDTRSLTKHLRSKGVMRGYLTNLSIDLLKKDKEIINLDLVKRVTSSNIYVHKIVNDFSGNLYSYLNNKLKVPTVNDLNIVILDFGMKNNILFRLQAYKCNTYILPATSNYQTISMYNPDGILLSNGPGDPSKVFYSIDTIKKLLEYSNIPIFGICMGHQLLSLALGAETFKLRFGHRGLNHPSGLSQYSEITSQNHGFAVDKDSFKKKEIVKVTHINLNDITLAGILHNLKPIFSVQYHPEASPGPHDSDYLFKVFIELVNFIKYK